METPETPRQGDYLADVKHLYSTGADGPLEHATPDGVVLMTQCCDMAREASGNIPIAAAVVELTGNQASNAASGRMPRYAHAAQLPDNWFVDFAIAGAVSYRSAAETERSSLLDTASRVLLANRVARRFSRFAYPDAVQPFIRKIQERIRSKARSYTSDLGKCIDRMQTIRVEADWDAGPPWSLTIVFVLKEGELPTLNDALAPSTNEEVGALTLSQVASRISEAGAGDPTLEPLWNRLAEAIVSSALSDATAAASVSEAVPEVLQESDYSYFRYRRSADLDVDDLSDTEG